MKQMYRIDNLGDQDFKSLDLHIGQRIKFLRKAAKVSQPQMGEALGVTFQQIQKYENGVNRVSASRLYYIARLLEVPLAAFYDGFQKENKSAAPCVMLGIPSALYDLIDEIYKIADMPERQKAIDIALIVIRSLQYERKIAS